jgi:hypothetical protein
MDPIDTYERIYNSHPTELEERVLKEKKDQFIKDQIDTYISNDDYLCEILSDSGEVFKTCWGSTPANLKLTIDPHLDVQLMQMGQVQSCAAAWLIFMQYIENQAIQDIELSIDAGCQEWQEFIGD